MSRLTLAFLIAAALGCGLPCRGQLAGNYTIDNSLPTAGTNYASFAEATVDLAMQGIAGPVRFCVMGGGAPYEGFVVTPIPGSSAVNTVTFRGIDDPVIGAPIPTTNIAIALTADPPLTFPLINFVDTGPIGVVFEGLEIAPGAGVTAIRGFGCNRLVVRNCRIHDCAEGIYLDVARDVIIEDNEIFNLTPNVTPSGLGGGAIILVALSDNGVIRRNRIHDCASRGIELGGPVNDPLLGTAPSHGIRCVNNMIWNVIGLPDVNILLGGGIIAAGAPGAVIAYNSIAMPAHPIPANGLFAPGIFLSLDVAPAEVSNNIISREGPGACIRFASAATSPPMLLDNNVYDPSADSSVGAVGVATFTSLTDWQNAPGLAGAESGSVEGPSGFLGATDLHIDSTSAGFGNGIPMPAIVGDLDRHPRHPVAPCRGADEATATGQPAATVTGVGCPGTNAARPFLWTHDLPSIGNAAFAVEVARGLPLAFASVFTAVGIHLDIPLVVGDCVFYLDLTSAQSFIDAGLSPQTVLTDGAGCATLPVPIPNVPPLAGFRFDAQLVTVDPGAPLSVTISNALTVVLQQ